MTAHLRVEGADAVRVIGFCNPPENYITDVMLEELYLQLLLDREDDSVRVVVLTGAVEDVFVLHYDVEELIDFRTTSARERSEVATRRLANLLCWLSDKAHRWPWLDRLARRRVASRSRGERSLYYWARVLHVLDSYPKPLIAAINGMCLGGGCEIPLCCDFRYMADGERYRIGLPEVLLGLVPGGTGTGLRLPRIVGEATALEMLLTGRVYRPKEAEAIGLVHTTVPPDRLMPSVMELAERLSRGAPVAQSAIRTIVRQGSRLTWSKGRRIDMAASMKAMSSEDAGRGMEAYVSHVDARCQGLDLEKRLALFEDLYRDPPVEYTGR